MNFRFSVFLVSETQLMSVWRLVSQIESVSRCHKRAASSLVDNLCANFHPISSHLISSLLIPSFILMSFAGSLSSLEKVLS